MSDQLANALTASAIGTRPIRDATFDNPTAKDRESWLTLWPCQLHWIAETAAWYKANPPSKTN